MKLLSNWCSAIIFIVLQVGGAGMAFARASASEPIDDLLVNQTITVAGQEFHTAFAALWVDRPGMPGIALTIRERPSARRGSTIDVEHANRVIFSAPLPPARAQIRPLAAQAVQIVHEHAVAQQVRQLLRDDDLASDVF